MMKRNKYLLAGIVLVLLAAAGAFTVYKLSGDGPEAPARPAPGPAAGPHAGHGAPAPAPDGSAPKDDMTDEEFDALFEGTEEAPVVEIPLERQQLMGVKVAPVEVRPMEKVTRTVGRVVYDETRLATVNAKFEGWIERLYVDYTGKYVKKGQPLAALYSPELVATQEEYLNLLRWSRKNKADGRVQSLLAKDSEALVEAARQRLRYFDISEGEIRRIEETGRPVRTLTIYSPVAGYVVEKMALQGMRVMPGEKLFDLADLSTVWILADIYENELPAVSVGNKARISLSYFPGQTFTSTIDYVYPTLSGETRTAKARFRIPNPGLKLKPQMFSNVEIRTALGRRLAVPESAVLDTGERHLVYVDRGEGRFEPREITPGVKSGGYVEVLDGLSAGESVAVAANFLIDSEARLKGIVK